MTTVDRNAYFVIHVTVPSGFQFLIPARGYNLKSWLDFEKNLNSTYTYEETTEEAYRHLFFGDPLDPTGEKYGPESKRKTQRKNPSKASGSEEKAKNSKTPRSTSKTTARPSKEKPSVVREPKLRNVRKPKKDVQGTDNSGKEKPPRTRRTTRQKE